MGIISRVLTARKEYGRWSDATASALLTDRRIEWRGARFSFMHQGNMYFHVQQMRNFDIMTREGEKHDNDLGEALKEFGCYHNLNPGSDLIGGMSFVYGPVLSKWKEERYSEECIATIHPQSFSFSPLGAGV